MPEPKTFIRVKLCKNSGVECSRALPVLGAQCLAVASLINAMKTLIILQIQIIILPKLDLKL